MSIMNTSYHFGLVAKVLHWLLFILIVGLLGTGTYSSFQEPADKIPQMIANHKQVGVAVFFLMFFRLMWRFINASVQAIQESALLNLMASLTHWAMYLAVLGQAVIGVAMTQAAGRDVTFLTWQVPTLFGSDGLFGLVEMFSDGRQLREWHTYGGYLLIALIVIHILAALMHHFYHTDDTLRRMWFGYKSPFMKETKSTQ